VNSGLDLLVILVVLVAIVLFLSHPLRRVPAPSPKAAELELGELQAAREAKYREIRDAELDHRTGKLSDDDYAEVDSALRAEAVEILRAIDTINQR
jgi:hypothetical protein